MFDTDKDTRPSAVWQGPTDGKHAMDGPTHVTNQEHLERGPGKVWQHQGKPNGVSA